MNKGTEELIADLLRAAVKIGVEKWVSKNGEVTTDDYEADGVTYTDHICNCEIVNGESIRAEFIAKANPAVVMTLIAALEQAQHDKLVNWEAAASLVEENEELKDQVRQIDMANSVLQEKLEQTQTEREEFRNRLKLERAILADADKRIAELENDEVRQRLANAEEQLRMAELAKYNLKTSRRAQFRKRLAAEKRIAELEARPLSIPAGWKIVPTTAAPSMARAGAAAAREYMTETGGNSPFVIYEAMVLAAPSADLEAASVKPLSTSAFDVLAERQRQLSAENWTQEHDDEHENGEMAAAAACYVLAAINYAPNGHPVWPWSREWWKPTNPRRDLVKAGALILAEIERLDRAAGGTVEGE